MQIEIRLVATTLMASSMFVHAGPLTELDPGPFGVVALEPAGSTMDWEDVNGDMIPDVAIRTSDLLRFHLLNADGVIDLVSDSNRGSQFLGGATVVRYGAAADPKGCNASDLAEPFGVLDLADLSAFVGAFESGDPLADLAPPSGVFDLADVSAFIGEFTAGCPYSRSADAVVLTTRAVDTMPSRGRSEPA